MDRGIILAVNVEPSHRTSCRDQLVASDGQDAASLKDEIEDLEDRIDDLRGFSTGAQV